MRSDPLPLPRYAGAIATVLICVGLTIAIVAGAKEGSGARLGGGATRLVTLQSNRYAYWRVALRAFREEPIRGVGAGGWAVWWLRYRPFDEFAQDAHSLPLQTAAELGLVGLGSLALLVVGVGLAGRDAHRARAAWAAGPLAALVVYAVHAPLDWDWQMPAVTLIAIVLAGAVVALAESSSGQSASAIRGASRLNTHAATAHTAR
jgi:O-antigen ligase